MATKRKTPARNKKGQFISKGAAKKSRTQFRKGGKPSVASCSDSGSTLRSSKSRKKAKSRAGSILMKCGAPQTQKAYFAKKSGKRR